jgi:hypothetical protein
MLRPLILEQKLVWRDGSARLDRRLMPELSLCSVIACSMHGSVNSDSSRAMHHGHTSAHTNL